MSRAAASTDQDRKEEAVEEAVLAGGPTAAAETKHIALVRLPSTF